MIHGTRQHQDSDIDPVTGESRLARDMRHDALLEQNSLHNIGLILSFLFGFLNDPKGFTTSEASRDIANAFGIEHATFTGILDDFTDGKKTLVQSATALSRNIDPEKINVDHVRQHTQKLPTEGSADNAARIAQAAHEIVNGFGQKDGVADNASFNIDTDPAYAWDRQYSVDGSSDARHAALTQHILNAANIAPEGALTLRNPMGDSNTVITSDFGTRDYKLSSVHGGIDFRAKNEQLFAQQPMVILVANQSDSGGFGKRVIASIGHNDKGEPITVQLSHLSDIDVNVGDVIMPGQPLATTGDTGAGGYHLDVQVRVGENMINPERAFTSDLSDSTVTARLVQEAKLQIGDVARTTTYDNHIAPALARTEVRDGLNTLTSKADSLQASLQADDETPAPTDTPPPGEDKTILTAYAPNDPNYNGQLGQDFVSAITNTVPRAEDTQQPAPITNTFNDGQETDWTKIAATALAENEANVFPPLQQQTSTLKLGGLA